MNLAKIMESEEYCLQPVQYYLRTFLPGYNMITHSHDYFEIMYVEDGEFILDAILNGRTEQFTIGEGQFVFLDSNVIHRMEVSVKVKVYNFEISLTRMKASDLQIVRHMRNLLSVMEFVKHLKGVTVLSDTANVLMTLKSIHAALDRDKGDDESHYLIQSLIFTLFIDIGRCSNNLPTQPRSIYITKVLNVIDKNLSKDLSPKRLSNYLGISESYLHRLFKQSTGTSIVDYVNEKRVRHAMVLLSSSDDAVIDIAITVGFNTRQNFGQIFRKYTGMTPSEYRKAQRHKEYDIPIMQEKIFSQKSYPETQVKETNL